MFAKILHRPVLALVISILIVLLGVLSIRSRPISQFPEIAPPQVQITVAYPGASADVLIQSTLIPLERAINGAPGMRYMISDATSAGEATIQVIFDLDTDPNQALINVKTRIDQVMSQLPKLVQLEGVVLTRVLPSMLMYVNVYSTAEDADEKFLFNFANVHVLPELMRVKGIGQARILGSRQFAMRIWLNPDRMRAYNVSAQDVQDAIREQSVIGTPGRVGQATGKTAQSLEYVLVYEGRFNTPEQYEDIILRATPDGHVLHLKDVAEVELGSEFFDIYSNLDGHPSAAIVLKQTLGSNAQEVIADVKATLEEIKASTFPPGMDYAISYDVSRFVDASIEQVLHTLAEAFVLVALVVFLFLGDWRSTLIPTLAVPVSLVGAFIFMGAARHQHQPHHPVRAGPGDRHRGRRRDRRRRGRARQDGGDAPADLRGGEGGPRRDQRRHHRDHPGDDRGVRPGGLHARPGRRVLPPVLGHDGLVDRAVRLRRADAHARCCRS
jgi:HAE1 family hydrophobic/amphiphilic exporter-1